MTQGKQQKTGGGKKKANYAKTSPGNKNTARRDKAMLRITPFPPGLRSGARMMGCDARVIIKRNNNEETPTQGK